MCLQIEALLPCWQEKKEADTAYREKKEPGANCLWPGNENQVLSLTEDRNKKQAILKMEVVCKSEQNLGNQE